MGKITNSHCDVQASFAAAFGRWRQTANLPLKQIARDLGISLSTVSSWERGQRFPSARHFEMLVEYTNLTPCRLICVMASQCRRVTHGCLLAQRRIELPERHCQARR